MSRRDSRTSMGARQTDTLAEYETLKKKFLLANKHITKLNSTLSIRVEELMAQVSSLEGENLRLRETKISLMSELKRERTKSRKVMADAEAATLNLTKHLGYLRQSLNIQSETTPPTSPTSPRAHKPIPRPLTFSPPGFKLSRPPTIPGIYEEEEPCISHSEDGELSDKLSSGKRKSKGKTKTRLSASKLPLPRRTVSPPSSSDRDRGTSGSSGTPFSIHLDDIGTSTGTIASSSSSSSLKRKSSRRQSGLLSIETENLAVPRPASPAFGSPIRLEAGLAEEAEEMAAISEHLDIEMKLQDEIQDELLSIPMRKQKRKSKTKEREVEEEEKEYYVETVRSREKKRQRDEDDFIQEGTKGKLKEVAKNRAILQTINRNNNGYLTAAIRVQTTARDQEETIVNTRTFLVEPSPHPSSSTNLSPQPQPQPEQENGGRERRVRKSVNYAEPKLNTKMRKPDPLPGEEPPRRKKRSSASTSHLRVPEAPIDLDPISQMTSDFPIRNGDATSVDYYSIPPSRPQMVMYNSPIPPSRSSGTSSSTSGTGNGTVKRKRSKIVVEDEGEESEGAQADAEYVPSGVNNGWVNTEGRRKSGGERTKKSGSGIVMLGETRREVVDERRHSMAV